MLINCPECGKEVSDKSKQCIHCGFPFEEAVEILDYYTVCPECENKNKTDVYTCAYCGHKYKVFEYQIIDARKRTCPCCDSGRIRAFTENKVIIPEKSKTQTSLNLNPLKPFTLFNQKEKVARKQISVDVTKFICDNCGNIW